MNPRPPHLVLVFPELSHADAIVVAQELEQELLRAGLSRDDVAVAGSDSEAMAVGGLLLVFGTSFLEGAARKLGEHSLNWLIDKYKLFIVAKSADGGSWTYGDQHRKGFQSVTSNDAGVEFGTLGVILLGASKFPGMKGLDNPAFERSAGIIQKTLTSEYLLFKETKQLNLFDASLPPLDTIERIETFIDENQDINDFLFYYCGHGSYLHDRSYYLTLRTTKTGKEAFTGLKLSDFRHSLESRLLHKRLYLILDCCFSGEAAREFMSDHPQEFVRSQIAEALPASGWAVMTASPRTMVAMAPEGCEFTMFTGALADALRTGSHLFRTYFSLSDLTDETRRRIIQKHGPARAVPPQCAAASQNDGDLARVPLFVNKAFDDTPPPASPDEMEKFEAMAREFDSLFPASRKAALENVYGLWVKTTRPEVKQRIEAFFTSALEDDSLTVRRLAAEYHTLMAEPPAQQDGKSNSAAKAAASDGKNNGAAQLDGIRAASRGAPPRSPKDYWRVFRVQGVLLAILGVAAVLVPLLGLATTVFAGWMVFLAGFVRAIPLIPLLRSRAYWPPFLLAILTAILGIMLALQSFAPLIMAYFIINGVATLILFFSIKADTDHWRPLVLSCMTDFFLAALLLISWYAGWYAIWSPTRYAGISLLLTGAALIRTLGRAPSGGGEA